jgi:predicted Zn-dependent protease
MSLSSCKPKIAWLISAACALMPALPVTAHEENRSASCNICLKEAARQFANGKNQEAIDLLKHAKADCREVSQYYLLLSTILLKNSRSLPDAEAAASRAVFLAPKSVPARMQYCLALVGAEKYVNAKAQLEELTALDESNYEAWSLLSDVYRRLHEDEKAQNAANKASELAPSRQDANALMDEHAKQAERAKEARQEFEREGYP